jgi:hypothetical protein
MATSVTFDSAVVEQFLRYAGLVAGRGYIHNTLGNMVIRALHPGYPEHGVAYTKHAGVSLEEMAAENVVITDIPSPQILAGKGSIVRATSLRGSSIGSSIADALRLATTNSRRITWLSSSWRQSAFGSVLYECTT